MRVTCYSALVLLVAAMSASAAPITFDFTGGSGVTGLASGTTISFTVGAVTLKATAWGLTASNSTKFESAQLSKYAGAGLGLGVCNTAEGLNCSDPAHQVDNDSQYELVLFQFTTPVDPLSVTIKPYDNAANGGWDRDVTYWVGNLAANYDLTGKTLADLTAALGLNLTRTDDPSTVSTSSRAVNITSGYVNSLLFGPRASGNNPDGNIDRFKINSATIDLGTGAEGQSSVPEPATMLLVGGALALAGARRFRKTGD